MNKTAIFVLPFAALSSTACQQKDQNESKQANKPNIVLLVADDLGYYQLANSGSKYYETPNIDALAEKGMRFTNAYAAATVCSPTRAAILTGKNPARTHITNFIPGNNYQDKALQEPNWQKFLPLEENTIAEVLKEQGYVTALFGKWHLSKEKTPQVSLTHNPDKQGFDETFVTYKPSKYLPLGVWQKPNLDGHNVDTITNRAIDFVQRKKDEPFFLMVAHNSIHNPLMEKDESIAYFENKDGAELPENSPVIGAMIKRLDASVGRLVGALEKNGLMENTLVVFYSDNGGLKSDAAQSPLREGKGWNYEGGIRVPLIVRYDGKIKPQSISETLVNSMDFFPTFCELAKVPQYESIDGVNLLPHMFSGEEVSREALYWNFPHYHNGPPVAVIRKGDYKLIENYEESILGKEGAFELYNLKDDTGEQYNLVDSLPAMVEELKQNLAEWRKEVGAQVPAIKE